MKKTSYILILLLGAGLTAEAQNSKQTVVDGVSVSDVKMERSGAYIAVDMNLGLKDLAVEGNRAVLLTPRLVNGSDSLDLPSIGIYGRRRYYFYVRNGESMLTDKDEMSYKASEKPDGIAYHNIVSYADWMNGAVLSLHRSDYGCCNTLLARQDGTLGRHTEAFFPELVFVQPEAEIMKSRSLSGSAYIDFPVDQTVIYPDYRRNTVELGKIQATIDSVRNDKDVTITSVWLKGYASPESPYKHNTELAIGRTAALKKHIGQLYSFADNVIQTDYEPEDWAGLRRYVEQSNIDHRAEILALIDSDMEPDAKEWKIKRTYPEEYRFMLHNFYPALRHTDYRIDYNIRTFSDADEIKRIMAERPQKLSLNEFYLVAGQYEPGTDEFTDVFQTAVRMFPNDETANLNAANAAIRRDDFGTARRYLDKAGDSAEAVYARGALAVREGDYDTAYRYLNKAKGMGLEQAGRTLDELDKRRK
ncbi:protein of unknown function [Alistipes timonensis JC136]|uniref:DUF3868 domain-containing protein n=1 Tax=Alistipes timonensis JC136 TaxID=1033731 RepID=A0A1H4FGL4_9BACT|nr:DUF3868 domain-containing protein [Alistipes timonensis]SEA96436.1 protein of unknown function [Alistipes timonensis JC136]